MPDVRRRRITLPAALLLVLAAVGVIGSPAAGAVSPSPAPTVGSSAGAAARPPTVTFGIGPSNGKGLDGRADFGYQTSAGTVIDDHFALVNISAQPLSLLVYGTDAVDSTQGQLAYQPRSAPHAGASAWLALPEINGSQIFRIKARSTVILPFQVRIPRSASPGDHTAGIAVGLIADIKGKSTKNLTLEQRVVAKVYVRVAGAIRASLAVEHLSASYRDNLNPFGPGSVTVHYTVHNTGNVDLGARQQVQLSGLFGGAGSAPAVATVPDLLPGSSATLTVHVRSVWPLFLLKGTVRVTPLALANSVDGTLTAASASASFWAIPWALLVLLVLLVTAVVLARLEHKRRAALRAAPSHRRPRGTDGDPDVSARVATKRAATALTTPNEDPDA